uniref:RING-type domain-containing protein n=1 Tax=Leersia perrieri TaxID=77586 RepID=A0A0D9V7Q3_9ORYZ
MDAATFLRCCHPLAAPRLRTPDAAAADSTRLMLPAITVTDAGSTCPVCLDDLEPGASAVVTPCEHVFHAGCITPWLEANDTCPICRAKSGLLPVLVQGGGDAAGAAAPDGLVLSELLHDGRYRLGRRAAGRVFHVMIVDRDGKLVRGGVRGRLGASCRRFGAAAGNLLRSRDRVIDFDLLVIS